jgi:hypothetical protein
MHSEQDRPPRAERNALAFRRAVGAFAFVVAMVVFVRGLPARAEQVYDPELVKAGVVAQLMRFVEWPRDASGPHPADLDVVFVGPSRVADGLRALAPARMRIRIVQRVAEIGAPHVVFVTRSLDGMLPATLTALGSRPVLVVGDGPSAARRGAAFGLRDDGSRVRIEVNRAALERARLRVSYHVLRLSTEVSP